jgi:predicted site-specific integrase-resolvase
MLMKEIKENPTLGLVTFKFICREFEVSRQTIYEWIKKGYFERIKVGRKNFVRLVDLEHLVNRQYKTGGYVSC